MLQYRHAFRRYVLLWPALIIAVVALLWICSRPAVTELLSGARAHPLPTIVVVALLPSAVRNSV
jgi:hypothetical protein